VSCRAILLGIVTWQKPLLPHSPSRFLEYLSNCNRDASGNPLRALTDLLPRSLLRDKDLNAAQSTLADLDCALRLHGTFSVSPYGR